MTSDGLNLTACVMFAVYGMAHTLWGGSSGGGGSFLFGALSVVGLAIINCNNKFFQIYF